MDDSALKEFTNVDAEDANNALGDLNSEEVADVGLKINVNKIKKDDPLKAEKEENNKTYNEEDTSLILSNDIYQDTDVNATGSKEQASVDASATGHAEMGGYGAVAPNNLGGYGAAPTGLGGYGAAPTDLGGYGAAPTNLGGYGATNTGMGGYGSSAPTLGAMEQLYQVRRKIWAVTARTYHLLIQVIWEDTGHPTRISQNKKRMPKRHEKKASIKTWLVAHLSR